MNTKESLKEQKEYYENLLLSALEVYHRLPLNLRKIYDELIKEYIKELKEINRRVSEITE